MADDDKDKKDTLEELKKAFESKYHMDEEAAFKTGVRRAKLMGLWVADQLGLAEEAAKDYARAAIETAMAGRGGDALVAKFEVDLGKAGVTASKAALAAKLDALTLEAKEQIITELVSGRQNVSPR